MLAGSAALGPWPQTCSGTWAELLGLRSESAPQEETAAQKKSRGSPACRTNGFLSDVGKQLLSAHCGGAVVGTFAAHGQVLTSSGCMNQSTNNKGLFALLQAPFSQESARQSFAFCVGQAWRRKVGA